MPFPSIRSSLCEGLEFSQFSKSEVEMEFGPTVASRLVFLVYSAYRVLLQVESSLAKLGALLGH